MRDFSVYLFDFDGTLVDTFLSLVRPYQVGFRKVGVKLSPQDVASYMHMAIKQSLEKIGIVDEESVKLVAMTIVKEMNDPKDLEKIKVFPDVFQTLATLNKRHKTMGIVSGNTAPHIKKVMESFSLSEFFKVMVGSDAHKRPKPFPDPLNEALAKLGLHSDEDIVYVGDSLQDVECAHNAGIAGILLDRKGEYPLFKGEKIASLKDLL